MPKNGFTIFDDRLRDRKDVSIVAKLLFAYMDRKADRAGAWGGGERLLGNLFVLPRSTVGDAIRELEDTKMISRQPRRSGQRATYQLGQRVRRNSKAADTRPLSGVVQDESGRHPAGAADTRPLSASPPHTPPLKKRQRPTESKKPKKASLARPPQKRTNREWSKADVEAIYKAYPKHVGKGAAITAIERALRKIKAADLLKASEGYAKTVVGKKSTSDWKYIPHPATWFNQERWMDDMESASETSEIEKTVRDKQLRGRLGRAEAPPGKYPD